MASHAPGRSLAAILVIAATVALPAQQAVRQGPPPEIRALIDGVVQAVNAGNADAWEAFAQARFSPPLLQQQTREQRAEQHRQIADRFGSVRLEGVRREGPEAPLQ